RATLADPLGLHFRRRFVFNGRELADVFEEDFDDPDSLAGSGGVPDPLLAELGRARTGQMRDIVATIQGEQDTIIRAPLETCLVVQGGPGTGKTARSSRAAVCSSSGPTRCSSGTSARCCRRWARRRRPR